MRVHPTTRATVGHLEKPCKVSTTRAWPTRSGDGWRSEKDRLRVLPASKQAALERATRLRAGPAPGIAAACSHPKNARQFERSYTWALENRSNTMQTRAFSKHRKLCFV